MLNKRGASPSGPAYGYKQVNKSSESESDCMPFQNPFGQEIRGVHGQEESRAREAELSPPMPTPTITQDEAATAPLGNIFVKGDNIL